MYEADASSNFDNSVLEDESDNGVDTSVEGDDEGDLEIDEGQVIIEKADRSLIQFYGWYKKGRLVIDPEWQRNQVWNNKRMSKLVESFLLDIPVPVIYLAKNNEGKYEVLDGLQRLSAVFKFFDNEYKLRGLEVLRHLEGKMYVDLPIDLQYRLEEVTLRSFELSERTPNDLLFMIFERLNTGGVALNRMEIRNCIYRGSLNTAIKESAGHESFIKCVNQGNISQRMKDREFVLRFLAFYERTYHKCKKGLGQFLNEFYETYKDVKPEKLKEMREAFDKSMRASLTIFGSNGFRLRKHKGGWAVRPNAAVFQAVSVPFAEYSLSSLTLKADAIYEEYLDMLATDKRWSECVTSNTAKFQHIDYAFATWSDRLAKVMADEEVSQNARLFSRELKKELFEQSKTCEICGQEIKILDDAALDHIKHYWRGGKTIPENARLVHRYCNSTRPNTDVVESV